MSKVHSDRVALSGMNQNPFEPYLGSGSEILLTDDAYQAPLPLQNWRGGLHDNSNSKVAFQLVFDRLQIVTVQGPATNVQLESSGWISLIFVVAGEVSLAHGPSKVCCAAGGCLVVPGHSVVWESTNFSVVCLMVTPQDLAEVIRSMLPDSRQSLVLPLQLEILCCCDRAHGAMEASLLQMLEQTLQCMSQWQASNPVVIDLLGIPEQLRRLMAIVALPRLRHEGFLEVLPCRSGRLRDAFDDLIDYIGANLDRPLNLTVLQNQSNYSRRALQYAFRDRLGCTATQWIRAQRLDLAYARLRQAGACDTVTSLAQACGYRSLGLFSIEFQQRFHIKPSVLLRESRAAWPSD